MKMQTLSPVLVRAAAVVCVGILSSSYTLGQTPTWVYDPNTNLYPNDVTQPFEAPGYASGSNDTRSLVDLGGGDIVLEFNTGDGQTGGSVSSHFELDAPAAKWNVSSSTGYSVEWKTRLDPTVITNRSANGVFAGNSDNWAFTRVYNEFINPFNNQHFLTAEVLTADGGSGGASHNLGNATAWHTYRMDVKSGVAKLYVDNYHSPVVTRNLAASGANAIWFGDGTGVDNGKYQVDYLKTWQNGVVGAPQLANPNTIQRTLLHASYDGNTGNNGLDADFARGTRAVVSGGGLVVTPGKFGAGALDGYTASGTVTYPVADNFSADAGTVEMWVNTSTWSDGNFTGLFNVYQAGQVDIRLQKTAGDQLQAYAADLAGGSSWSITSAPVSLNADWHHIAWTWDENVNMTYLYVDGVPVADLTNVSISNLTGVDFLGSLTDAVMEVGSIQGGSSALQGLIDEFRISNADLYQGATFTPQNAPFELQRWAVDADGAWSNASNWTGGVPDYTGATANFLGNNTASRMIDVDGFKTVGVLRFDSAQSYTLGGAGTLALDVGTFSALLDVRSGSHTINTPILLARNLTASVAGGSTINLTNDVLTPGGVSLSKTGAGTLIMKNLRMDGVDVAAGTLRVSAKGAHNDASGVSVVTSVNATGKLDLTNNAMAIEYSDTSPLASVRSLLQSGYAGGSWNGNGINSSSAAAQALTSVKTSLIAVESVERPGDFFGQSVDESAVLIFYGLSGDATIDGKVNTLDFNMLAGSFGGAGGWTAGDFTYDGTINSADFNVLVGNYGNTMPAPAATLGATLGAVVPEPASLTTCVVAAAMLRRRRRPE